MAKSIMPAVVSFLFPVEDKIAAMRMNLNKYIGTQIISLITPGHANCKIKIVTARKAI